MACLRAAAMVTPGHYLVSLMVDDEEVATTVLEAIADPLLTGQGR